MSFKFFFSVVSEKIGCDRQTWHQSDPIMVPILPFEVQDPKNSLSRTFKTLKKLLKDLLRIKAIDSYFKSQKLQINVIQLT